MNDNLIGLIYYRTSADVADFILAIYDNVGNYKQSFIVASVYGEYDIEREKSCILNKDNTILIKDISLKEITGEEHQKAIKIEYLYKIVENNVKLVNETNPVEIEVFIDEHSNIKEQ
ncbi:MAG: hypothetical protein HYR91_01705 [Flavobacteriia bacterium]|nr:hypothetical protein [Flavobacteriia bacterium]